MRRLQWYKRGAAYSSITFFSLSSCKKQEDLCRIWLWDLTKTDHTLCCAGSRILLRRDTDITASGYRYYCVGIQILLRRDADITASGYRYYCVGVRILLRRGTDITASASADVSVGLLRRLNSLTELLELAN